MKKTYDLQFDFAWSVYIFHGSQISCFFIEFRPTKTTINHRISQRMILTAVHYIFNENKTKKRVFIVNKIENYYDRFTNITIIWYAMACTEQHIAIANIIFTSDALFSIHSIFFLLFFWPNRIIIYTLSNYFILEAAHYQLTIYW